MSTSGDLGPAFIKGRFEKRQVLGEGGMGVVYRAYDRDLKREVALKTLRDGGDTAAIEMFRKECGVLASINHPNIVDIYDVGEFEEAGERKPYFVMPLLPGTTLDHIIKSEPHRLTVDRTVEIIAQTCRGLQAAHDRGLIHRDLKPSNIFVLNDDSVKIIDFGIAYLAGAATSIGLKGTVYYMAPEQLEMRPASPQSDIYALGVVCFEALTRRRPFAGSSRDEVIKAVLRTPPPAAHELNPVVSASLSQVVHAALAKKPAHRYQSAREFADYLQRALRHQPMDRFDPAKVAPRLERVEKALAAGELDIANELLAGVEDEGFLHPSIQSLRKRVDQGVRGKAVSSLLESARKLAGQEPQLALQKLQEVLDTDPRNAEALALRTEIESKRKSDQSGTWMKLARQHLENQKFGAAREAVSNLLAGSPADAAALRLKGEIERAEQALAQSGSQKRGLYEDAVRSFQSGDMTAALSKIERVLELEKQSPDRTSADSSAYQALYNDVRSGQGEIAAGYQEARQLLEAGNLPAAAELCEKFLQRYPDHALFQALRFDLSEAQRHTLAADMARVDREVEAEMDLHRKVKILEAALARHPGESHFERALKVTVSKRDLVDSILQRARQLEDRGSFQEALSQWDILRNIYPSQPGLEFEIERLSKRRDQQARTGNKARWVEQIDRAIGAGDPASAEELVKSALREFPEDAELEVLRKLAQQSQERAGQAQKMVLAAREFRQQGKDVEAVEVLRKAHALDVHNPSIRAALTEGLVAAAAALANSNTDSAGDYLEEALALEPGHTQARNLQSQLADQRRDAAVNELLSRVRNLQASGQVDAAMQEVQKGLATFPLDPRLTQMKSSMTPRNTPAAPMPPATPGAGVQEMATSTDHEMVAKVLERAKQGTFTPIPPTKQTQPPVPDPAVTPPPPKTQASPASPPPATKPPAKPPYWIAALVIPALAALGWVFLRPAPKTEAPAAAVGSQEVQVALNVAPESARVKVAGRDIGTARTVPLPEGEHVIEISADGFEPQKLTLRVSAGMQPFGPVTLQPAAPVLVALLGAAQATLNNEKLSAEGGQITKVLQPGDYTLQVFNGPTRATIEFSAAAGAAPVVKKTSALNMMITVVSRLGAQMRIFGPRRAGFGSDLKDVPAAGLELAMGGSDQRLNVTDGSLNAEYDLGTGGAPSLAVYFADPGREILTITNNEEGANVMLNGRQAGVIRGGRFQQSLVPGPYRIKVVKPGFLDVPERVITVARGTPLKEAFELKPATGSIVIVGATHNAQVLVDDKPAGDLHAGEPLTLSAEPGKHKVTVKAEHHQPLVVEAVVKSGEPVRLAWKDLAVSLGYVQLEIAIPGAAVTYTAGNDRPQTAKPGLLTLPVGNYVFRAVVNQGSEMQQAVAVAFGQAKTVKFEAQASSAKSGQEATKKAASSAAAGVEALAGNFKEDDGWTELSGGQAASLKGSPIGSIRFDLRRRSRVRSLLGGKPSWMVVMGNQVVRFEVNNENIQAFGLKGGRESKLESKPIPKDAEDFVIDIRPDSITHTVGGQAVQHTAAELGVTSLAQGQFRFRGPVAIRNFRFTPR